MLRRFIFTGLFLATSFFSLAQNNELEMAFAYYRQGEYDKAAELYKKLSTDKRYTQLIHHDYFNTLVKLKDYKTAEAYLKGLIGTYGQSITYRANLAEIYDYSGRTELAEKEYDKLINEAAGQDNKIYELIQVFSRNKNNEGLVKLILKDREVTKNNTKFDSWLASAYHGLGMKDKMIEEVLGYARRNNVMDYAKAVIQDNFTTEEEIKFIENLLLSRIQSDANDVYHSELLIWWYAHKKEFSRAFIQARALDKRLDQTGARVFELAGQSYTSKDFKNASRMYQYILDEYPKGELYPYARTLLIKSKEEIVKTSYPIEINDIKDLIADYKRLIDDLGINPRTLDAMQNMALLQAFYLNDLDAALATLNSAVNSSGSNQKFRDQCKLHMGDIYILKNEPWESTLLYLQVEKAQKEDNLGELAKLKNAKLQYFTGQFDLAKDILDVLKKATSKEISNDAMQLSLLIEDNTGLDSTEEAMKRYAHVELLLFQNKLSESLVSLDSLYSEYKEHTLADEILWLRANTRLKVNRIEDGIADLRLIVENHAEDILADDALYLWAKMEEENKQDKMKAMELYKQILTQYPGSVYNASARVKFRELRGDYIN